MSIPVITLKSGLKVANFSSPHSFNFVTGEVLPACSPERANLLKCEQVEVESPGLYAGTTDVRLHINLGAECAKELARIEDDDNIDIVLVPFMILEAMKRAELSIGKARCIRSVDRVTKAIYADKFCV